LKPPVKLVRLKYQITGNKSIIGQPSRIVRKNRPIYRFNERVQTFPRRLDHQNIDTEIHESDINVLQLQNRADLSSDTSVTEVENMDVEIDGDDERSDTLCESDDDRIPCIVSKKLIQFFRYLLKFFFPLF
jgi:hypothetical protein